VASINSMEPEDQYTKAKVYRYKEAYQLLKIVGYPSIKEAVHLVEDANIIAMTIITGEDIGHT
jgi:hypothetical protein